MSEWNPLFDPPPFYPSPADSLASPPGDPYPSPEALNRQVPPNWLPEGADSLLRPNPLQPGPGPGQNMAKNQAKIDQKWVKKWPQKWPIFDQKMIKNFFKNEQKNLIIFLTKSAHPGSTTGPDFEPFSPTEPKRPKNSLPEGASQGLWNGPVPAPDHPSPKNFTIFGDFWIFKNRQVHFWPARMLLRSILPRSYFVRLGKFRKPREQKFSICPSKYGGLGDDRIGFPQLGVRFKKGKKVTASSEPARGNDRCAKTP